MGGAHHFIDAQGESRRLVVALDGRVKLVLLAAALVVNLTAGGMRVPLLLLSMASVLVLTGGVRAGVFCKRMVIPAVLALVAFLTQLFWVRQGGVVTTVNLHFFSLVVHQRGLEQGLELGVGSWGAWGCSSSFPLPPRCPAMMRAARFFRCPPVLVELALIMYRYIFLLLEEGARIRTAQKARLGFVDFRRGLLLGGDPRRHAGVAHLRPRRAQLRRHALPRLSRRADLGAAR